MFKRLFIYLKETPKIWNFILLACLIGYGVQLTLGVVYFMRDVTPSFDYLIGIMTYFLVMCHWRINDELKDYETDKKYFPDRPVPAGKVKTSDLTAASNGIAVVLFAINLTVRDIAFGFFLFVLVYTILMSKWFFLPDLISNNRLLAFITHAPAALFLKYYLIIIFCKNHGLPVFTWDSFVIAFWFCCPLYAQEFARKTYAPAHELAGYQTYSSMIGYVPSTLIALFFTVISFLLSVYLHLYYPFHNLFIVLTSLLFFIFLLISTAFLVKPEKYSQMFVGYSTLYIVLVYLVLIIGSVV